MSDDLGHGLLLAFPTDDPAFALGFEVGRAWAVLRATDDSYECEMHAANAETILRLAEATDRSVQSVEHDDTWLTVTFSAASEEGEQG